ncbi:DUF429 domain-containing protein [Paenibacillus sp. IB182496]|uniref:DUF429 domain-containing protein n=1 Tax=Paenibacillus sabuli TaxID=2772509 RepID=A0A927BQZ6_9BACL|nr:DUF429 domain-containing protein [Paenibacillus sabuli]MBD2843878.1 DUF429 domain-containing protein [Paenibacillus sabuli]
MYIGIDGCRGGWVAARLEAPSGGPIRPGAALGAAAVPVRLRWELTDDLTTWWAGGEIRARRVLLDMPLGLQRRGRRACDVQAMERLGPVGRRRCFHAPSWRALARWRQLHEQEAPGADTDESDTRGRARRRVIYDQVNACNAEDTGLNLTPPGYALLPRIDEARRFVIGCGLADQVREAHPELMFMALGGGELLPTKHAAEGLAARRRLLLQALPESAAALEAASAGLGAGRLRAKPDDLYDAAVLAVAGLLLDEQPQRAIWLPPRGGTAPRLRDPDGLPVEIVGVLP